ncbi:hypothetical protein [Ruegeria sp. HKCCA4812]|uniref:hypothetical protein n=1 Tax=Ruegeria sp. HKCCA4812 TaxID=2682993 RepID=UPI001488869C|nr:hypothetical protein [Ruegeria sp. HKCCA4812]
MTELELNPGEVVVVQAFDDVPEHLFRIDEVFEDCVTGFALTGPLAGSYGEPDREMILRVISTN